MESEEFISRIKEYKKEMFLLAVSIVKNMMQKMLWQRLC